MEPAKIDWKRLEWKFVEDQLYEHINAPMWVDFSSLEASVDDDAWFCRPDCKHPKTPDDFLRFTPPKLSSSGHVLEALSAGDRNQRDAKLKRRGLTQFPISSYSNAKFKEDRENQSPNIRTPPNHQAKSTKASIKSSAEKKPLIDDAHPKNEPPRLRSTPSARNLFAGRDILNQFTEFCSELKRIATRTREKDNVEIAKEEKEVKNECDNGLSNVEDKERKPFSELSREESGSKSCSVVKQKQRIQKRLNEGENVPISLILENVKQKREENLLQIRTNPPTPQCFSAIRAQNNATPASRTRLERGVHEEKKENHKQVKKMEEISEKEKGKGISSIVDARGGEARALDVLWFLKPCTLST